MSMPVMMYYCTHCDFEQGDVGTWGNREYILGNGVRIPVNSRVGWCDTCNGIAPIEDLSMHRRIQEYRKAQQSLQQEISRASSLERIIGLSKSEKSLRRIYEDSMDDAIDALEILVTRKSPPRCLSCLGIQVHTPEVIESGNDGAADRLVFRHPGCDGELLLKLDESGMRIALRPRIDRYTPEGEIIDKEYVSGYSAPDREYWDARSDSNRRIRALNLRAHNEDNFGGIPKFLRKCAD